MTGILDRDRLQWLSALALFAVMAGLEMLINLVPYLIYDVTFWFREDNFWSYSSGFSRRALIGELLYWFQAFLGIGPWILSIFIYLAFIPLLAAMCRELFKTASPLIIILLMFTPFALSYGADAEIFLLLPLLAMTGTESDRQKLTVLALIAAVSLIREIALILYIPVLLRFISRESGALRYLSIAYIGVMLFSLVYDFGAPNFSLETGFWPQHGVSGLEDTVLYGFATTSLGELIAIHYESTMHYPVLALIQWGLLAGAMFFYLAHRNVPPLVFGWFIAMFAVSSVLTIDHGRYAYMFFMFAVLLSSDVRKSWFDFDLPALPPIRWATDLTQSLMTAMMRVAGIALPVVLALLIISPSGFHTGDMDWTPRVLEIAALGFKLIGLVLA